MMEALSSSETSVLTRATRRNIPEDAILQFFTIRDPVKWYLNTEEYSPILGSRRGLISVEPELCWAVRVPIKTRLFNDSN
jgi:hypothetical protein